LKYYFHSVFLVFQVTKTKVSDGSKLKAFIILLLNNKSLMEATIPPVAVFSKRFLLFQANSYRKYTVRFSFTQNRFCHGNILEFLLV